MTVNDLLILGQVLFLFAVSWWILVLAVIGVLALLFAVAVLFGAGEQIRQKVETKPN